MRFISQYDRFFFTNKKNQYNNSLTSFKKNTLDLTFLWFSPSIMVLPMSYRDFKEKYQSIARFYNVCFKRVIKQEFYNYLVRENPNPFIVDDLPKDFMILIHKDVQIPITYCDYTTRNWKPFKDLAEHYWPLAPIKWNTDEIETDTFTAEF